VSLNSADTTDRSTIRAHADVVGSLLRPAALVKARGDLAAGAIAPAQFKAIEDHAVEEAVALQEDAGLEVVTDGEMRRLSFQSQMTEAVDGFGPCELDAFLWGQWHGDERVGDWTAKRPAALGAVGKLTRKRHLAAEEFTYLRACTTRTAKISLTSPSLWANFWSPERSVGAYPTLDRFLCDIVGILRDEVAELVRLGATYIQLDAPHYSLLVDPRTRAFYEQQGWSVEHWLERGIEMDNAVIGGFPGVTFGFHLCRGNQGSRWLAEGGYARIAKPIFQRIGAQRLLLEYDDARSGSFDPLREVPDDKMVVLGLVTTKSPRLESTEELTGRIKEASRFVGIERLALSPQCGFASSIIGNRLSMDDQRRKLHLVMQTAKSIWR
jgi:5-methyltetrahydropteroyltriglutamate--homocysteine methyltransferase